jgi:hypothetical protein
VTLLHLLGAALAVAVWFTGWEWSMRRLSHGTGALRPGLDAVEAVFLTLFASLWFASLGHGAWWVLFLVLALLIEGPARLRHRGDLPGGSAQWRPVLLGLLRLVGAGALLALIL